jgi:hypothetical protein
LEQLCAQSERTLTKSEHAELVFANLQHTCTQIAATAAAAAAPAAGSKAVQQSVQAWLQAEAVMLNALLMRSNTIRKYYCIQALGHR